MPACRRHTSTGSTKQDQNHDNSGPTQANDRLCHRDPSLYKRHPAGCGAPGHPLTLQSLACHDLGSRLTTLIRRHPDWPRDRIADSLAMSGRHLNRKLAERATSFRALREQILYQQARDALKASQRPADIAERLGFSDESAFARAFRRWSGTTPTRYAQQHNSRN